MKKLIFSFLILACATTYLNAQQELFLRKHIINPPPSENSGFGEAVVGVDFDGDGKKEIYFVNSNWGDAGAELIPRIYKFEQNTSGGWDSVWSATLDIPLQNTWPALTYGDWDNDGKMEIIWGPVNNLNATTNPNPARIVVFEQGVGDVLGILDAGNYRPNAKWTITDSSMQNLRPFRFRLYDINNDGKKELIYVSRVAGAGRGNRFGVVSVSYIPDNGNNTETWSIAMWDSASTPVVNSSTLYDFAVLDSTIYLLHSNGSMTPVYYANGNYTIGTNRAGVVPGGTWKSSMMLDLNGDGTKEIVVAGWASGFNGVYVLQKSGDSLTTTTVADFDTLAGAASQLYGGAFGDIDNDGKIDFIFGTRSSTPDAAILRMEFQGGDITSAANYKISLIDKEYPIAGGRWDILAIANLDADADGEMLYSSGVGSMAPGVIVDRVVLDFISIGAARIDANGDFIPDRVGDTVGVVGVVNNVNFTASSNRFQYAIQDETGGVVITKGSETGGGRVFNVGDKVFTRGKVSHFRGTTQLDVFNTNDIVLLETGVALTPVNLSIPQYIANAETYESMLIKFSGIAKAPESVAWPAANADANMTMWDAFNKIVFRVDKDTDLDDNPEPAYPIAVVGTATQYTSSTAVHNDGYQISPSFYNQITPNVPTPPSPHFALLEPANNAVIVLTDSNQSFNAKWRKAVDLNGDAMIYQFVLLGPNFTSSALSDTTYKLTALQILGWLGANDSITTRWTARAKGAEATIVPSVDTFTVTFKNDIPTSLRDGQVPVEFYVNQNYPNPFNPETAIRFGLPTDGNVDLRVYNILGQEIAVLLNNEFKQAGNYKLQFNGKQLASGTYIYRLQYGSKIVTKKMILTK